MDEWSLALSMSKWYGNTPPSCIASVPAVVPYNLSLGHEPTESKYTVKQPIGPARLVLVVVNT